MNKIKVGEIINTHGIKGELKVQRTGVENFDRDIDYFIDNIKVKIKYSKIHKNTHLIKLVDYDNINDVIKFKSKSIYILEEDLINLEEDEFYIKDLIGLEVFEDDSYIGELADVLEYQVNDVYVVESENGQILIPAVDEFIISVDIENKKIQVKLIEGM